MRVTHSDVEEACVAAIDEDPEAWRDVLASIPRLLKDAGLEGSTTADGRPVTASRIARCGLGTMLSNRTLVETLENVRTNPSSVRDWKVNPDDQRIHRHEHTSLHTMEPITATIRSLRRGWTQSVSRVCAEGVWSDMSETYAELFNEEVQAWRNPLKLHDHELRTGGLIMDNVHAAARILWFLRIHSASSEDAMQDERASLFGACIAMSSRERSVWNGMEQKNGVRLVYNGDTFNFASDPSGVDGCPPLPDGYRWNGFRFGAALAHQARRVTDGRWSGRWRESHAKVHGRCPARKYFDPLVDLVVETEREWHLLQSPELLRMGAIEYAAERRGSGRGHAGPVVQLPGRD